ncbi:MAG: pyridoxal-phosphate dependent enzyme, partial [Calditrichaeota bacterium]
NPETHASGLRVPGAIGDFLILDAIRKSNGTAISVSEDEISQGSHDMAKYEGIFPAPEGGAALAAFYKLKKSGFISETDSVVIFNTGSGYKYLEALKERL